MSQNYKDTLNLPRTEFPMKANLAAREPEMLRTWEEKRLYQADSEIARKAENSLFCMTARRLPTATSTWAPRSTKSSRISW